LGIENENNQFNKESTDFGVPNGYFQKSAVAIFNKIEWEQEHKSFPKLLQLKSQHGFITPSAYFSKIEQKIELLDLPILFSLKKVNSFTVPVGYFENVEVSELAKILDDKELFLPSLVKQNPFKVSDEYFSIRHRQLEHLLQPTPSFKVVKLFSVKSALAIAALLVVVLGIWLYNSYFTPVAVKDCGTIACVDKVDLLKIKHLEGLDNDELYELVNSKKLEQKLETKSNKNSEKQDSVSEIDESVTDALLEEI
jgi:hypothetical protein